MTNWKEYKVEDFAEVIGGGTPSTNNLSYFGGSIPWITPKDLTNYEKKFISNGERNITKEGLNNSSAKMIPKNAILLTSRAPIGYLAIAANDVSTNQGFKSLVVNPDIADYNFIFYLIKANIGLIKSYGTGTTFAEVSSTVVKNLKFNLPPLPTQTAIAEILSSLDDKIELNNKINAALENLAQTLFKQWFIDFEFPNDQGDPYKSSGGEMIDSKLGIIPKGWEVKELGLVSKLTAGGDKPKKVSDYLSEEFNVPIYSNGITNYGLYGYTDIAKIFEESVTISARGTIGFVCLRTEPFVPIVRLISAIADDKYISTKYLYMWLKNLNIYGNGTTQQQLTVPDFRVSKILIPIRSLMNEYTNQMNVLIESLNFNKKENQELTKLRDTLLPKLISGELAVTEVMAEKV